MTTVSLRFDDEMKKQLDEMGMNLTTFFMIYAKESPTGSPDSLCGNSPSRSFLLRFQHGTVKESKRAGEKRAGNR